MSDLDVIKEIENTIDKELKVYSSYIDIFTINETACF
jgi:hypothetical protein